MTDNKDEMNIYARLDERTKILMEHLAEYKRSISDEIKKIEKNLLTRIDNHEDATSEKFKSVVEKSEFEPVRTVTYGIVGVILLAVGAAILKLIGL